MIVFGADGFDIPFAHVVDRRSPILFIRQLNSPRFIHLFRSQHSVVYPIS